MAAIELAPNHKTGFALRSPVMGAAGCWGFGREWQTQLDFGTLGAFVTNPLTWQPRTYAQHTQAVQNAAGLLLHTGLPNPGWQVAERELALVWRKLPCPVIVHWAAEKPHSTARFAQRCAQLPNVQAIELGFAATADPQLVQDCCWAAAEGLLPVLVQVPAERVWEFGEWLSGLPVQAVVLAAPARAALPLPYSLTQPAPLLFGRWYSPAQLPPLLAAISLWAAQSSLPVVASGGIHCLADAQAVLAAGALAFQIDTLLWRSPALVQEICHFFLKSDD